MAIDIITGFNSSSRESLDKRSGPYASLVDAKAALDTNERYVGLRVLIADGATPDSAGNFIDGDLTEYVFSGGIADNDLVDPIATAISNLIDSAPETLDTFKEIADALGDGNFTTSVTDSLATLNGDNATDGSVAFAVKALADGAVADNATNLATTSIITSDVDVGGISKTNTVPSGTTIQGFITQLLSKTYYPTFILPSVSLTDDIAVTVEVGTLGLTLTANYNAGAINGDISGGIWDPNLKQADRAGVATQYTFSGTTISGSPVTQTGNSLALPTTTIEEGVNTFNVVTDHDAGPQPLDSLGQAFDLNLPSGDVSDGLTVNGKRNAFYGVDLASIDSAGVRALTSKLNPSNGTSFTINIPAGAIDVVFAYPATLRDVDSVIYVEGLNAEIKTSFSQQTVNVEGANSYTAIGYKLYTFTPANPFGATATYTVTI